jgi:hypothetical protein
MSMVIDDLEHGGDPALHRDRDGHVGLERADVGAGLALDRAGVGAIREQDQCAACAEDARVLVGGDARQRLARAEAGADQRDPGDGAGR